MIPAWPGLLSDAPSAGIGENVVDVPIEDTEKEEGDKHHDKKVANEKVISTIAKVLSQVSWTYRQLTICLIFCSTEAYKGAVQFVTSAELKESRNVPQCCQKNNGKNVKAPEMAAQSGIKYFSFQMLGFIKLTFPPVREKPPVRTSPLPELQLTR